METFSSRHPKYLEINIKMGLLSSIKAGNRRSETEPVAT